MNTKETLLKDAESGNAESQYSLGLTYMEEGDSKKAKTWLTKAAKQGHPYAMMELASIFDFEENIEEAKYWWLKATDHEDVSGDAMVCLHMVAEKQYGPIPFHEYIEQVLAEKADQEEDEQE